MENSRGRHEMLTSGLHVHEGWQWFILHLSLCSYGSQNSGTHLWAEGMCAKGSCEDLSHWVISLAHTWLLHVGTGDRTRSSCLYSWSISSAPISLKFSRRWKQSMKPNTWLLLKTSPVTSPVCHAVSSPPVQPCLRHHPERYSPSWPEPSAILQFPFYRATTSARPAELRCCAASPPLTVSSRFPCWFLQDKTSAHLPLTSNACPAWKSSCCTFKHPPLTGPSLHLPQALLPGIVGFQLDVFQWQEVWV